MDVGFEINFCRALLNDEFKGVDDFTGDSIETIEIAIRNRQDGSISERRLKLMARLAKIDPRLLKRVLPGGIAKVDKPWALVSDAPVRSFARNPRQHHSSQPALNQLLHCDADELFRPDQFDERARMIYDVFVDFSDLRGWTTQTAVLIGNPLGEAPVQAPGTKIDGCVIVPRAISLAIDRVLVDQIKSRQVELFHANGLFEQLLNIDKSAASATFWIVVATVVAALQDSNRRADEHKKPAPYMSLDEATVWLKSLARMAGQLRSVLGELATKQRQNLSGIAQRVCKNQHIKIEYNSKEVKDLMMQWHSYDTWNVLRSDWKEIDQYPDMLNGL